MGELYDSLKKIQEIRQRKYTLALKKASEEDTSAERPVLAEGSSAKQSKPWFRQKVFVFSASTLLCINIGALVILQKHTPAKESKAIQKPLIVQTNISAKGSKTVQKPRVKKQVQAKRVRTVRNANTGNHTIK